MTEDEKRELETLRARVVTLEAERAADAARVAEAVAQAQEQTYWLDRWHLDLNALMAKPWAPQFRAVMSLASKVARRARRALR